MNNIQTALDLIAAIHDTTTEQIRKQIGDFFFFATPEDIALILANIIKAPEV